VTIVFPPRVKLICAIINDRYSGLGEAGTYPGHGEDPPGPEYAADFWTTNKDVHDAVLHWVIQNADWLGIKYIISWKRIWSVARASEGIRNYTRYDNLPNPSLSQLHKNHVHISFDERKDGMAVEIKLDDASIRKVADAVSKQLGEVWTGPDTWTPPPGEATPENPTWTPGGTLRYIANTIAKLAKP
jgi:hypothetical protein